MINFQNISKNLGGEDILRNVSLRIPPGKLVGITGPNGAGKSTLFKILTGELSPDEGTISIPSHLRLGHVRQQPEAADTDATLLAYSENAIGEINQIQDTIEQITARLSGSEASAEQYDKDADMHHLGELQSRFEHLGGYELKARAEATLMGLGFSEESFQQPFSSFSGGWQIRAELARVLVARPDVLLLDEPTNYLDVSAVEWLHRYLCNYQGSLLLISHDRYLLNTLTNVTLEVFNGRVERYPGNYDYYTKAKEERKKQQAAEKQNRDKQKQHIQQFVNRFRAQANKAAQVQSRLKMLDKMEDIELPETAEHTAAIKIKATKRTGAEVLKLNSVGFRYSAEDGWIFRNLDMRIERGMKTAILGPNGRGKTTLLRLLAGQHLPEEGRRVTGANVVPGYLAQESSETMASDKTVFAIAKEYAQEASDSEVRNMLGGFGFSGDAIEKKVHVLSGGEKIRLGLARILLSSPNLLLLDEPTTHLDIPTRRALENALVEYDGTLCFVSHDIEFIRNVADSIFELTPEGPVKYFGGYDYYREKSGQNNSQASQLDNDVDNLKKEMSAPSTDRKAQRRQQAENRQTVSRKKKPLMKKSRDAEHAVDKLHREQEELTEEMQKGTTSARITEINQRLHRIQKEITEQTNIWEEAEQELEKLTGLWHEK